MFAAVRSDLNLTAVVINKTNNDLSSTVSLANFAAGAAAKVWRYSGAKLGAIVAQPDAAVADGSVERGVSRQLDDHARDPAGDLSGGEAEVRAVTNAASY